MTAKDRRTAFLFAAGYIDEQIEVLQATLASMNGQTAWLHSIKEQTTTNLAMLEDTMRLVTKNLASLMVRKCEMDGGHVLARELDARDHVVRDQCANCPYTN